MKPIIVLISVFLAGIGISWLTGPEVNIALSGRIAMAIMLLFTALGHFIYTDGMMLMLPDFIPAKRTMVLLTGFIEILAAIGLLMPAMITITGILLIIFFILILPTNIYAAYKKVNLEKASYTGKGLTYLWLRIPMQVFFIAWVYWFTLR